MRKEQIEQPRSKPISVVVPPIAGFAKLQQPASPKPESPKAYDKMSINQKADFLANLIKNAKSKDEQAKIFAMYAIKLTKAGQVNRQTVLGKQLYDRLNSLTNLNPEAEQPKQGSPKVSKPTHAQIAQCARVGQKSKPLVKECDYKDMTSILEAYPSFTSQQKKLLAEQM